MRRGFTLIELSIVLVIIGLIVGGVLLGQDLIAAARVRAQISQIEKYSSAVYAFRSKYNGLPGDLAASQAVNFGFTTGTGAVGDGDGNGQIEPIDGYPVAYIADRTGLYPHIIPYVYNGEETYFWIQLSQAGLIDGTYVAVPMISGAYIPTVGQNLPVMKFDPSKGIGFFSLQGRHYFQLGVSFNGTDNSFRVLPVLTPQQAYEIDQKIDDGIAGTGSVQARGAYAYAPFYVNEPEETVGSFFAPCTVGGVDTTTPPNIVYNLTSTTILCSITMELK